MAKFSQGQFVSLRDGRIGKILAVLQDALLEQQVSYSIRCSGSSGVPVSGAEILALASEHLWNRHRYGLSEFESAMLDRYTGPTFKEWNAALRSGQTPTPDVLALQAVLKKAPQYTGYVYRGLKFATSEALMKFMAMFTKGQKYVTPQFLSTSKSNAAALNFKGDVYGAFMRLYTDGTEGAGLRTFTGSSDLGENEVLFRYGSEYDVLDVIEHEKDKQYTIQLTVFGAKPPVSSDFIIPAFKKKEHV